MKFCKSLSLSRSQFGCSVAGRLWWCKQIRRAQRETGAVPFSVMLLAKDSTRHGSWSRRPLKDTKAGPNEASERERERETRKRVVMLYVGFRKG